MSLPDKNTSNHKYSTLHLYSLINRSFTYGYGQPPIESVSLFVIIVVSIGLGVPLLLALSGVSYVLVRRYRQRNQPERFIDDE